jgi:hypothetical protein
MSRNEHRQIIADMREAVRRADQAMRQASAVWEDVAALVDRTERLIRVSSISLIREMAHRRPHRTIHPAA